LIIPIRDDSVLRRLPIVTYGVIFTCSAVFVWELGLNSRALASATYSLGMIPAVLLGHAELPSRLAIIPAWATVLTSMFVHGGWLHLLGNMLYLWLFGRGVESTLGPIRFSILYLISGMVAAMTQAFTNPVAEVPMIGASGAIAGTLGAYLILLPRANVVLFIWIFIFVRLVSVPAILLLALWFATQLLSAVAASPNEPGVAFWAHVGGFVAGMVLVLLLRGQNVMVFQAARSAPFSISPPNRVKWRTWSGSVPPAGDRSKTRRGRWG